MNNLIYQVNMIYDEPLFSIPKPIFTALFTVILWIRTSTIFIAKPKMLLKSIQSAKHKELTQKHVIPLFFLVIKSSIRSYFQWTCYNPS